MTVRVFDVDYPVVLADDPQTAAVWDRMAPAPLMVAALSGPESRVLELNATDGLLSILAAALGSAVTVTTEQSEVVLRNAALNDVDVTVAREHTSGESLDLVIVHDQRAWVPLTVGAVIATGRVTIDGLHRVDLIDQRLEVDACDDDRPHLLVDTQGLDTAVQRLQVAAAAFADRQRDSWVTRSVSAALRRAQQAEQAAERTSSVSQQDVRRAHDQMREALAELRAMRASRSWRYTEPIRQWSRR